MVFKFIKRNKTKDADVEKELEGKQIIDGEVTKNVDKHNEKIAEADFAAKQDKKETWTQRLFGGLKKTRKKLGDSLVSLVMGAKQIDDALKVKIEKQLIAADVGVETSEYIIQQLTEKLQRNDSDNEEMVLDALKAVMVEMLEQNQQGSVLNLDTAKPFTILMVGINGAGKTTSIAKMAQLFKSSGKKVLLAAGDTFRAAAIEQLSHWGEQHGIHVIKQPIGSDSASVVFDALSSAKAKNVDVLLADTAGRLHTQQNLMSELLKIKRVMTKQDEQAPHEVMLVVDATLGQNSLQQVKTFNEAMNVTGLCITKLDGSAKGGIVFAIAKECGIPIRFVGVGEKADDLQKFEPKAYVEALFDE